MNLFKVIVSLVIISCCIASNESKSWKKSKRSNSNHSSKNSLKEFLNQIREDIADIETDIASYFDGTQNSIESCCNDTKDVIAELTRVLELDECDSDPCQNGGRCIDRYNGYKCECAAGFFGINCENGTAETIWWDIAQACITNNNNRIIDSVATKDDCKALCVNEEDFVCRSIDYNDSINRCQLSVKFSGNNPIAIPCQAGPEWSYAERQL